MMTRKPDRRIAMLRRLLNARYDGGGCASLHASAMAEQPHFYLRLALWNRYVGGGRELDAAFVGTLIADGNAGIRSVGLELLSTLPVTAIAATVRFMKTRKGRMPRSARSGVVRVLRGLEAEERAFDCTAVASAHALKYLYATLRIRPSTRADAILFKGAVPVGSLYLELRRVLAFPGSVGRRERSVGARAAHRAVLCGLRSRAASRRRSPADGTTARGSSDRAGSGGATLRSVMRWVLAMPLPEALEDVHSQRGRVQ